jgi:hypothetical protein
VWTVFCVSLEQLEKRVVCRANGQITWTCICVALLNFSERPTAIYRDCWLGEMNWMPHTSPPPSATRNTAPAPLTPLRETAHFMLSTTNTNASRATGVRKSNRLRAILAGYDRATLESVLNHSTSLCDEKKKLHWLLQISYLIPCIGKCGKDRCCPKSAGLIEWNAFLALHVDPPSPHSTRHCRTFHVQLAWTRLLPNLQQ